MGSILPIRIAIWRCLSGFIRAFDSLVRRYLGSMGGPQTNVRKEPEMEADFFECELEVIVLDDASVSIGDGIDDERIAEAHYIAWFTDWRRRYGLETNLEA